MDSHRPARPQEGQELGLTDSVWEMTVRCWDQDPAQRPMMSEVVGVLHGSFVSSRSIEADLCDFFKLNRTLDGDGQEEKALEFADSLDEVRHTERHNLTCPHHKSRFLTT